MNFFRRHHKIFETLICLGCLVLILLLGISVYKGDEEQNSDSNNQEIDFTYVNNIDDVETNMNYKMKISQSYLLTYTTNKAGIWYMSNAVVYKVKIDGTSAFITLTNDSKTHKLITEIESNRVNVKRGDKVHFVGTVDLETGNIELAKISLDEINYNDVEKMEFTELVDNIKKIKDNLFVIHGYMITDGTKYKLFDSKSSYEKDSSVGTYFTIKWDGKFNYTGNANVTIECKLNGTYKLKDCTLIE